MATIAQGREVLKQELQAGRTGVLTPWLPESVEAGCRAAGYRWRERFWTPLQTMWTFLWQVLHVGSSCRDAVAMALRPSESDGVFDVHYCHQRVARINLRGHNTD